MENKLPTYRIKLKPDGKSSVYAVSLVDSPAIEVDWIKLSKEVEMMFAAAADKQMLYGPLLIPGKLIFRRDEETGQEYNIIFEKETIEEIVMRYNKSKINDIFNINHSGKQVDAYLAENWVTGKTDKSRDYGFELPEGTWFGGVKVENSEFWLDEVKSENVKGFSVEIQCGIELMNFSSQVELASYNDYPQAARDNAQRAINYKEKNGSDCGTAVGWTRARQLANGDNISEETINRMSAFQRHQQYKNVPYDEGCGGIMWDAWGGNEGIAWAERKSKELKKLSEMNSDTYINKQNKLNFMEIKTNEGVSLYFEGDLTEGVVIFLDEAMTELAPEGEHTLEDGRIITLDAESKVLTVAEAQTDENENEDLNSDEEEDNNVNLALDPNEVMNAIQPALDEFRSILAELSTRLDALENHEAETPVMPEEYSSQIEELKTQVEKLASTAGVSSLTEKSDKNEARNKKDEEIVNKLSFFRTIKNKK